MRALGFTNVYINRSPTIRRWFLAIRLDKEISDAKSVSKTIGLKPSRTRDYLKIA
jgi:hypothetical protein